MDFPVPLVPLFTRSNQGKPTYIFDVQVPRVPGENYKMIVGLNKGFDYYQMRRYFFNTTT
jgi:hypothetical protein